MDPQSWGPNAWKFLHTLTFQYPINPSLKEQRDAENLFSSFSTLLPCEQCRQHYDELLQLYPPQAQSRLSLATWLVDIHNRVNAKLGKQSMHFDQAQALYSTQCLTRACQKSVDSEKLSPKSNNYGTLIVLFFLILLVAGVFMYNK
jgi:FAD-linked sulfhydryl oxidase